MYYLPTIIFAISLSLSIYSILGYIILILRYVLNNILISSRVVDIKKFDRQSILKYNFTITLSVIFWSWLFYLLN